jgi:hypothetical protein
MRCFLFFLLFLLLLRLISVILILILLLLFPRLLVLYRLTIILPDEQCAWSSWILRLKILAETEVLSGATDGAS